MLATLTIRRFGSNPKDPPVCQIECDPEDIDEQLGELDAKVVPHCMFTVDIRSDLNGDPQSWDVLRALAGADCKPTVNHRSPTEWQAIATSLPVSAQASLGRKGPGGVASVQWGSPVGLGETQKPSEVWAAQGEPVLAAHNALRKAWRVALKDPLTE